MRTLALSGDEGGAAVRRKFIRDEIERQGKTQQEVARDAGIHYNTLWNIINDREYNPTYDTLVKLAKALNVSITLLLDPD